MRAIDLNDYFEKVSPFLRIGCSLHEACLEADVPYSTCYEHYRGADDEPTSENLERIQKDRDFRQKIDAAAQFSITVARQTVYSAIGGSKDHPADPRLAFDYLRSKRPDEFAQKNRVEHEGGIKVDYGKEFDDEIARFSKPPSRAKPSVDNQGMDDAPKDVQEPRPAGEVYQGDAPAQTQSPSIR